MKELARTPDPPYYAVVFTSRRAADHRGYAEMADRMLRLAREQPGFLGVDSVREGAMGITVSYWESLESIREWKRHGEHLEAQRFGRETWYEAYSIRIARVERAGEFAAT
jgi:heme-degrading monooxygenase HmoA